MSSCEIESGKVGRCPDVQWVGNEMCPCGKLGMVVKLDG